MDSAMLWVLVGTAGSIGFVHTLIGTDHYLPFILLSRARNWTRSKTLWITLWCGLGHVLSSVVLGMVGIALGFAVSQLEHVEGTRGSLASWLLIAFGLAYFVWGLRQGWKGKTHSHTHVHADGKVHVHDHIHQSEHSHVHQENKPITPWALFIIFVLGPCEPLIPFLMYPASEHSWGGVVIVVVVFGMVTIGTMMAIVALAYQGLVKFRLGFLERYTHALAGGMIALSGLAIKAFGF